MAITGLSEVIVPEVFAGYIFEEDNRVNRLIQSGAVVSDANIAGFLAGGGTTFNVPSWQATDGDAENISSDLVTDGTANALAGRKQIVSRCERNGIWSSADLTAMLAGSDPLANAAARISQFRMTKRQNALQAILEGLYNTTNGVLTSSHTNSIAEKATAAAPLAAEVINAGPVIDTLAASADEQGTNVMIVHSDTHRDLQKKNLITYEATNTQNIGWGTYLGFTLVVDDGAAVGDPGALKIAGGTNGFWYKSYLMQPASVTVTGGVAKVPVEVERYATQGHGGGVESLIVRDSYAAHVYGTSWTGSPASEETPDNDDFAIGTNWGQTFEDKKIGVTCLEHNIGVGS